MHHCAHLTKRLLLPCAVAVAAFISSAAWSQESSALKLSGFVSVVGGAVVTGNHDSAVAYPVGFSLPSYTADWSNAGVYEKDFSLTPESRVGIQATYSLSDRAKLTAQLVSRGTDGTPNLTWAYGGYKISDELEVQVGRKRIPLYYYSDFQDIGVAYPWVSPPPELYGWDATNYNGASLRFRGNAGGGNITASLFAGREDVDKSLYSRLYNNTADTKVTWKDLFGADMEYNRGPVTVRGVYLKADVNASSDGVETPANLVAYGFAANLDFDDWFVLSEATQLSRDFPLAGYKYTAPAFTVGLGMRWGNWTPFVNYAQYAENSTDLSQYVPQKYTRTSLTLRYDLNANTAIKSQIDWNRDASSNYGGDVTVLRVSYDRVF